MQESFALIVKEHHSAPYSPGSAEALEVVKGRKTGRKPQLHAGALEEARASEGSPHVVTQDNQHSTAEWLGSLPPCPRASALVR